MSVLNVCTKLFRNPQINPGFRNYAFKSDLKIKWVRPEKIPKYKPEKSGDLTPMPKINTKDFAYDYRNSKELQDCDELVQRLYTLELQPRRKTTQVYTKGMVKTVQRHVLDKATCEAKIARLTAVVRSFQQIADSQPYNRRFKVILTEIIEKRNKQLRLLRGWDYKRFEWIIENLDIVYKPQPLDQTPVTRKASLKKITQKYCDDIKSDKLNLLRKKLEDQQPAFLEEKIRVLEFIQDEQKECNVEVTITKDDVLKVKEQLQEIYEKRRVIDTE